MISDTTYDIINTVADAYVPNKRHPQLHVNSRDMWVDIVVNLVNKGLIKPRMAVIIKCALSWETLLTTKLSRLN